MRYFIQTDSFIKMVYFLLGALLPLPIFYDLSSGLIIIERQVWSMIYVPKIPVPIGFFIIIIIAYICPFIHKIKIAKEYKYQVINALILSVLFFLILMMNIKPVVKSLALFFPYFLLYILYHICLSRYLLPNLLKGYVFSWLFIIIMHSSSICMNILFKASNCHYYWYSNIFGYGIYQSLVSYSAVLSFFGCSVVIFILSLRSRLEIIALYLMSIIIFFILMFGARKAMLMDMLIVFILLFIYYRNNATRQVQIFKDCGHQCCLLVVFLCLLLVASVYFYKVVFNYTKISGFLVDVWYDRKFNYMYFFSRFSELYFTKMMFADYGKRVIDWSDLASHNLFMNFVLSIGFFGAVIFLYSFFSWIKLLWFILKQRFNSLYKKNGKLHAPVKTWIVFAIYSFIGANMWNTNYQLPYYVINICFTSLCFFYFYKED